LSDIPSSPAYLPLPPQPLIITELDTALVRMSPNKAPGADNIPVLVLQKIWPAIRQPLYSIFKVCFRIGYYPKQWREAVTLILRKPGRPDYAAPNAYRPIALLCTMGKILEAIIAHRLSYLADLYGLLPNTHIGSRPGRSTEDGIVSITEYIKHEWRRGRVVGALLIDVKNAFPSVSQPRLLHNLRKRRVPYELTSLIESFLTGRRTSIKCAEYTSPQSDCEVGIPQGSPLSGILYLFYNADLLDIATTHNQARLSSQGWVDDIIHLVSADTVTEARAGLQCAARTSLTWGVHAASILDKIKTQYTYFTRNPYKLDDTPLLFGDTLIPAALTVTYLGVELDRGLRWHKQGDRAVKRAQGALMALASLTRTTWGVPTRQLRLLVTSCVNSRSDYAAIAWHQFGTNTNTLRKLDKIQHMAQRMVLGAFRTTPSSALAFDSNMEPSRTRLDRKVTLSAIRLLTLPGTNPAAQQVHRALSRDVRSHRTSLHKIFHSPTSLAFPRNLETVQPQPTPPWWRSPFTHHITSSKEEAYVAHTKLPSDSTVFHLYSDGSKTPNGIGAGAYCLHSRRRSRIRLNEPSSATVFEGELEGIRLALLLAADTPDDATAIFIHLDNQAAILACSHGPTRQPAQHLILAVLNTAECLRETHPLAELHLNWIPGHVGIRGNEIADEEAKKAANDAEADEATHRNNGRRPSASRPTSAAATRQLASAHFTPPPENPHTGAHHRHIRGDLSSKEAAGILASLRRGQCSILVQLRSGHVGLRSYLARFAHVDSPLCTRCTSPETVDHYLTTCRRYSQARSRLTRAILDLPDRALHRRTRDLTTLLSHPDVIPLTLQFISDTGRFPLHAPLTPNTATQILR
jgi:ribonuclease HI